MLDASLVKEAAHSCHDVLNRTGRLLVFSRRFDGALLGPWTIEELKNAFLAAEEPAPTANDLPSALTPLAGNWRQATLNGRPVVVQDGASVGDLPQPLLKQRTGSARGAYATFLKQIYRDHFFPLAVAGGADIHDGQIDLSLNLLDGRQACEGGVVFGFRDTGHHFVVGLDAHHMCIVLHEFAHSRRFKRLRKRYPVYKDRWYDITLRISGLSIHLLLNGVPLLAYTADRPVAGQIGMWAAADSVVVFDGLSLFSGTRQDIPFSR